MSRSLLVIGLTGVLSLAGLDNASAQTREIPADRAVSKLPRQHLAGPRFGFTVFTGDVADYRSAQGKEAIMSQFGWQFETQIISTESGNQALMEWVVLFGGLEQSDFAASLAWLAGYRLPNGLEFGVGPNVSIAKGSSEPTTSMVVAGGTTLPFGEIFVPLNLAVAFADGGPRLTTLIGWIIG